jgi:hypothetical protein
VEPQYKWQPVTDFYKEQQATQTIDPEAETQQKLQEIREQAKKTSSVGKKAPIGITVFNWYLVCRASFYVLLLAFLATFPQSDTSKWVVTTLERSVPGHAVRAQEERQRAVFRQYGIDPDTMQSADASALEDSEEAHLNRLREFVMVFLFAMAVMTSVVAFMWWNRSWKVRWFAMAYAGGFCLKAGVNLFAGWASGVGNQMSPSQMSSLVLAIVSNGLIFGYLAFWPGVEEWFKEW